MTTVPPRHELLAVTGGNQRVTRYLEDLGAGGGGTVASVAWTDITGKPSTFAPSSHSHPKSEVTGLVAALAAKQPLDPILTGTTASFTTALDTKLNGIAAGATVGATWGVDLGSIPAAVTALSGTNTGDQTSIVGISGTKAQFNTAVTDGDFLYVGDVTQYTDEAAQDAVGAMVDGSLTYVDATPLLQRAALTGAITASAGSNATSLGSFTKAQLSTAVSDGDVLFVGDVTSNATHTGDVTGSTVLTIANDAVTYAKMQNVGANSVLARAAATSGDVGEVALAASQLLGRGATGDVAPIALGTNLSMSGTTLNATGGSGGDPLIGWFI